MSTNHLFPNPSELQTHYQLLLGLKTPWRVSNVVLEIPKKSVTINVEYPSSAAVTCPECQKEVALKDHREVRKWRHLDTMQFETIIVAKVPRSNCPEHGVKTIHTPWADSRLGYTLMFEAFALSIIQAASSLDEAANLLNLSWDQIQLIQERAVKRGLQRRKIDQLQYVGIDEKSFLKGHKYASVLVDSKERRVLDVVEGRTLDATLQLWDTIPAEARKTISACSMDMWDAFKTGTQMKVPQAAIVHDKFHIAQYLNKAVDAVRRAEHKDCLKNEDTSLKGTKYLFLKNPLNFNTEEKERFDNLRLEKLKVGRAWSIKEAFNGLWQSENKQAAKQFFKKWYGWATRSRLKPIIDAAKTIYRHIDNIITYIDHPISNGIVEGFNSKIQAIKSNARGFRSFKNYRTRILFYCGRLDLSPI